MYESGDREPDFETLELIADFFNVDIDYLLGRTMKTTYYVQSHPYLEPAIIAISKAIRDNPELLKLVEFAKQLPADDLTALCNYAEIQSKLVNLKHK